MGLFGWGKKKNETQQSPNCTESGLITPLFRASYSNDIDLVSRLLQQGEDPNVPSLIDATMDSLFTPSIPQKAGALVLQQLMLKERHPEAFCDLSLGINNLHYPSLEGYSGIVGQLLDAGENPNARSLNGLFPLYCAAEMGHLDIVKDLIEHGADVNQVTPNNCSALLNAAEEGHTDVVRYLLEVGADPDIENKFGATALDGALRYQHLDTAMLLMQQKTPSFFQRELKRYKAIPEELFLITPSNKNASLPIAERLADGVAFSRINFREELDGETLIYTTGIKGYPFPIVELFEGRERELSEDGHLQYILDLFLGNSVPVYKTINGSSGYLWSSPTLSNGNHRIHGLRSLLEHAAPAITFDLMGAGILEWADDQTIIAPVEATRNWLLEWYCDYINNDRAYKSDDTARCFDATDQSDQRETLIGAIAQGNMRSVEKALSDGFNANECYSENGTNTTPLVAAAIFGDSDIVDLLLESGANPNKAQDDGTTPLAAAARYGNYSAAATLLEAGADVNAMTPSGTALAVASNIAIMQLLWSCHADLNKADEHGVTPIMAAVASSAYEAAYFLLLAGADPCIVNIEGQSTLNKLESIGDQRMLKVFYSEHYESPESDVNIIGIRDEMLGRIEKLKQGVYPASHFADLRIMPEGSDFSQAQKDIRDMIIKKSKEAIDAKRMGNLNLANNYYIEAFSSDLVFNTDTLWGWVKVLLLAKNFRDARLVMEYYSSINARRNCFYEQVHDDDLNHVAESAQTFEFDGFTAFSEYASTYPMDKAGVEEKIQAFGGSALWSCFTLTADEYNYFLRCFGIDDLYVINGVAL